MLWYKAWRETRTVTLFGVGAMALACLMIVHTQQTMRDHSDVPLTYIAYIYKSVYHSVGCDIFIVLSVILGAGGMLQEAAAGTVGFTLSLPASRMRIMVWRALVGYLGVLAIAVVPVVVLSWASRYAGQSYPVGQAGEFFLLWATCGALFYGYAFLLSHVMEGEYVSTLIAIPTLMLYGAITDLPWLARFRMNIFDLMSGEDMPFFDEHLRMLTGMLPWLAMTVIGAVAVLFIYAAVRRMQPRDF
jgi:ABC-2 type transport system permease protein